MKLTIQMADDPGRGRLGRGLYRGLCALTLYAALWGCLSSMAYLSDAPALSLTAGATLALALPLTERRRRSLPVLLGCGLLAAALLLLTGPAAALDGGKYYLNRLFAASAARQSYEYEIFSLSGGDGFAALRRTLVPAGILSGLACGASARYGDKWIPALVFAGFCGLAAWLGVTPAVGWTLAFLPGLLLPFLEPEAGAPARPAALLAAALLCLAVLLLCPGEDLRLSAWDEAARDRLAAETVAYADAALLNPPEAPEAENHEFRQLDREDTDADTDGGDPGLKVPYPVLLAILLTALLLFAPAFYSDALKQRRAKNRAGLEDPDPAACIRAAFLYAMRWLSAGGVAFDNRAYADCAGEIGAAFPPELERAFLRVLPIWQEAAYSEHPMDGEKRGEMLRFLELTRRTVWDRMGRLRRLRIKYIEAL